jgi:hypothetical protein
MLHSKQHGPEDQVVDDCIGLLRAGKNVVNVSDPALVYPKTKGGNVGRWCEAAGIEFPVPPGLQT